VWEWFVSVRAKDHRLSGPIVQEYAKKVAEKLGKAEFKASNGWLESFRKRHQIVLNEICGKVTASTENENDQQDLQNCMNEAAFSNCNAEDYINIDKDVQTEPDTMDID
jgi:hypothetical protein